MHCFFGRFLLGVLAVTLSTASSLASEPGKSSSQLWVYFGTYTHGPSKGIYLSSFDMNTGKLHAAQLAGETANPSFVAHHPHRPLLYAIGEIGHFAGKLVGAVSAFAIQPKTGMLKLLNQQGSGGAGPCHVSLDPTGRCVLVANYGGGSVASLPVQADGRLGPAASIDQHHGSSVNRQRQEGPHAHSIYADAAGRFALSADLGLDKIFVYHLDAAAAKLSPNDPPALNTAPGTGPRHLAFDPTGRTVYAINEMASTICAMHYDPAHGTLAPFQTISTLPKGFHGSSTTAEIQMHPSGKFLYGSNRGHDSIAIYSVDAGTGRLRALGHESTQGKTPRSFAIDPTGHWLLAANQDSNNVVVFRIAADTGHLKPTGEPLSVASPVCVDILPPIE